MSNPTAAMAFMLRDRLQKMRDAGRTAKREDGAGESAASVQLGTSSGRGSDRELTWVTCVVLAR